MTTATRLKQLRDAGIIDAIIEGKPIEQRRRKDLYQPPEFWEPWDGSIEKILHSFTAALWDFRIKPTPREFWIVACPKHGDSAGLKVRNYPIQKECGLCEIVRVVEASE